MKSKWDWCLPDVVIFCIWAHLNGIIEMQIIILPLVFICYKTTTWNIEKLRHKHFCHIKTFWQTSSFFFYVSVYLFFLLFLGTLHKFLKYFIQDSLWAGEIGVTCRTLFLCQQESVHVWMTKCLHQSKFLQQKIIVKGFQMSQRKKIIVLNESL